MLFSKGETNGIKLKDFNTEQKPEPCMLEDLNMKENKKIKNKIWTGILAGIICLYCFAGSALAATAEPSAVSTAMAGATAATSAEEAAASAEPSASSPANASASTAASSEKPASPAPDSDTAPASMQVHGQSFSKDYSLTGLPASASIPFNVGNWEVKNAVLNLSFSVTQIANMDFSTITLSLNGENFYTQKIDPMNGEKQILTVDLPVDKMIEGSNTLLIQSYIKSIADDPDWCYNASCIDDVSGRNWINLYKESSFELSYTSLDTMKSIADFCNHFTSIDALEYNESTLAVNSNAEDSEIQASLIVLSGLSANAALYYDQIGYVASDGVSGLGEKNILYISKLGNLPSDLKSLLTQDQISQATSDALIALVKKGGQNILLITGDNAEALVCAAKLVANKDRMLQLDFTSKPVQAGYNVDTMEEAVSDYQSVTDAGTYVKGAFRQSANFYIQYPENRLLSSGSEISLDIRYAENLDFDRSLVTVYIDDEPVGSKKLSKDLANGDTVTLQIPTDLNVSGSFTLTVSFDLEIKDLVCTPRATETPWGYVANTSMIKLNSVDNPYLLFDSYPAPFIWDGGFNNVALVIPDSPDNADYQVMASFFKTMGRYMTGNRGSLTVLRAQEAGKLDDYNVIMIGSENRNSAIKNLNDSLLFQFNEDGSAINSNEKKVIDPQYSAQFGTAQLIYSPYSTNKKAILVLSGVTDDGMLRASAYFSTVEKLWEVNGDGFVADSDNVYCFKFKDDNSKELSFADNFAARTDLQQLIIVVGSFGLIIVIALVILIIKYRKVKKNDKE